MCETDPFRDNRELAPFHLYGVVENANGKLLQRVRRRSCGHFTILVVHAAVAGTHKEFGRASQRTGQPRCVQSTAKASKVCSSTRRNHAAVSESLPPHAIADESSKVTLEVWPTGKPVSGPTSRHTGGSLRKSGASRKPTDGKPDDGRGQSAGGDADEHQQMAAREQRCQGQVRILVRLIRLVVISHAEVLRSTSRWPATKITRANNAERPHGDRAPSAMKTMPKAVIAGA